MVVSIIFSQENRISILYLKLNDIKRKREARKVIEQANSEAGSAVQLCN